MTAETHIIEQLTEFSLVLGSAKRTVLLFILNDKPMSYTEIDRKFRKLEIGIGSSEVYKHLDILMDKKFIAKKGKVYLVTLKGKALIENLSSIVDTPPKVPKLQVVF